MTPIFDIYDSAHYDLIHDFVLYSYASFILLINLLSVLPSFLLHAAKHVTLTMCNRLMSQDNLFVHSIFFCPSPKYKVSLYGKTAHVKKHGS